MFRFILWSLLAAFLLLVGVWPAAAAPVALAGAGLAVVVGKIPGVVLLGIAAVLYLRHRPAPRPATA
ncbi:hypothetical protein ACFZAR_05540 [Streptomyces sp. NPDC008222]|uniref:hypothetical protein n=1 Tax=Streptomyces sp. NPDC008222 TaxID=3364820 RepID=UPI0036E38476